MEWGAYLWYKYPTMKHYKIRQSITQRETPALNRYLNEIGKEQMVSSEKEIDLARRIQEGDQKALEELTRANLRFVVSIAKQYQNQGLPLSDLINEGNIGLIKAAQRFDASKGFKFISYAVWWIRQSILQAIVDNARLVRLPLNKAAAYHKINKATREFQQSNERLPTLEELSEMVDLKPGTLGVVMNNSIRHQSTDAPLGNDEDFSFSDTLEDRSAQGPEKVLMFEALKKELKRLLEVLSLRERKIIEMYFGMDGAPRMTLAEIGDRMGLTRERIRQIKERALRKLRRYSGNKVLQSYFYDS